jgi:hypothetical protein
MINIMQVNYNQIEPHGKRDMHHVKRSDAMSIPPDTYAITMSEAFSHA